MWVYYIVSPLISGGNKMSYILKPIAKSCRFVLSMYELLSPAD